MFVLDIETVDIESTSAILSLAVTHVTDSTNDYQSLLDNSIFIKFDLADQLAANRTTSKETLDWWDRQAEIVKETSLYPSKKDISVSEGNKVLKKWLDTHDFKDSDVIFVRGFLDSLCLESLFRKFDLPQLVRYNQWLDVRSVISVLYENSVYGYVEVDHPTFNEGLVIKHHPVHDCAYDAIMLKYGKK